MALNVAAIQVGATTIAAALGFISLHTAQPNSSGSNAATSARVASGLTASAGVISTSNKTFTGGVANGPVTHVGFWSAITGGTFYGYQVLTGDNTFNSLGEFTITTLTLTGSAS